MRKVPNINTHIFKQPNLPWRTVLDVIAAYPNPLATEEVILLTAMIQSQMDSGNWDKMDSLVFMNLIDATNSLWDVKRGISMIAVNDPTHSPGIGRIFNGTTQYINSNYNPHGTADGINFQLDNAQVGVFYTVLNTNDGMSAGSLGAGNARVSNRYMASIPRTQIGLNGTGSVNNDTDMSASSLLTVVRASSASLIEYRNGVQGATTASGSASIANFDIYIGARNANGVADLFADVTLSSFITGAAIGFNHSNYYSNLVILNTGLASL